MILFLAAALAAAAPDAAVACPQDDSASALICRALAAEGQGQQAHQDPSLLHAVPP